LPLLWLSAAFVAGILLGKSLGGSWLAWGIVAGLALLLSILDRIYLDRLSSWRRFQTFSRVTPGLVLFLFSLGALRYLTSVPPLDPSRLAWYNDRGEYSLVGTISAPPEIRTDDIRYKITFSELTDFSSSDSLNATRQISSSALVTLPRWSQWQYGDQLMFFGSPRTPSIFPGFSYKDYLARQGIQSVIYYPAEVQKVGEKNGIGFRRWLIAFRERARILVLSLMPQPESGLLNGILLGLENDIPPSLKTAFRDTGISHIIAISGFNMTLIATLLIFSLSRILPRVWGVLAAIGIISVYTVFVDGSSAVVRAAIMASTAAVAHLIGRRQSGLTALFFTAALLCLVNPQLPWDVSFQLSFTAVLGLVVFGSPMQAVFTEWAVRKLGDEKAVRISGPVSEYFLFTLAAQLTTLPVIALQFKRISLISLLSNPLILPVQPAILQAGLITTVAGSIHPLLGKFCALFTWPLLAYTNFVVTSLAKVKGASMTLHPTAATWILLAFLLVLLAFLLRNFFKKQFGGTATLWLITLLAAGSFSVWSLVAHRPDGKLHLRLVDAGDTSSLVVQTPAGSTLLFDLQGDARETSAALTPLLSPWQFHLDALVLSRPLKESALADFNDMVRINSLITSNTVLRPAEGNHSLVIPEAVPLAALPVGEPLELEPGLSLTIIGEATEVAAYALYYNQVTLLIPAGVDYALLKEAHPDLFSKTDILLLSPEDISYIPPRLWVELDPVVILWNSREISPYSGANIFTVESGVSILSDGETVILEKP